MFRIKVFVSYLTFRRFQQVYFYFVSSTSFFSCFSYIKHRSQTYYLLEALSAFILIILCYPLLFQLIILLLLLFFINWSAFILFHLFFHRFYHSSFYLTFFPFLFLIRLLFMNSSALNLMTWFCFCFLSLYILFFFSLSPFVCVVSVF